jgi:DNA repair exonuclease SbcCD ATPase subunit
VRLLSAEYINFCQFRYQKIQFASGLTAILGRNGCGKSNLIKGIYAAITGDYGRNDGVKLDNVSQFAAPGDPSRLHAVIEHAGTTIDITRSLRPSSTRLIITPVGSTDSTTITKAAEASDAIINILGISGRMLGDYVFVDQWAIFDFLAMMPAERAKAFQRLFHTEQAEALWKTIGTHQDKLVIPTPGIDRDGVTKRLNEYYLQLEGLEITLAALDGAPSLTEEDKKLVQQFEYKQLLQTEISELESRCKSYEESIEETRTAVTSLTTQKQKLETQINTDTTSVEDAYTLLEKWKVYYAAAKVHAELVEKKNTVTIALTALNEPQQPIPYVGTEYETTYAGWWNDHNARLRKYTAAQHFMQLLSDDDPFCPTCGTPRKAFNKYREAYERDMFELSIQLGIDNKTINTSNDYRHNKKTYDTKHTDYTRTIEELDTKLDELQAVNKPNTSSEVLNNRISNFVALNTHLTKISSELYKQESLLQSKLDALDAVQTISLKPKIISAQAIQITEEQALDAKQRLIDGEKLIKERAECNAQLNMLKRHIIADEATLVYLQGVETTANVERWWKSYCEDLRNVLHRDNLPRIVAQTHLELMQDEINELLTRFDSPFKVTTDDTLSFIATFKDGRKIPATRLSGGEKVLLAIAFRVVVNDLFAKDLGLLILDEPTAGLDDGNLSCLRIAIERLKEISASRGLQMIMITHEKELAHLFDRTIEVGKD